MEESIRITTPVVAFKDENSKDMSIINKKIAELVTDLELYLNSKNFESLEKADERVERIKKYYVDMENINKENNDLYAQIESIKKLIEENEERKRLLTEEFNKEGILKK